MNNIFYISLLALLLACNSNNNMSAARQKYFQKFGLPDICNCSLSDMEMTNYYPIAAIEDSIVMCKLGTMNGKNWTEALYGLKLHDNANLYNCMTDSPIVFEERYALISYEDKAIHIWNNQTFKLYIEKKNAWENGFDIPVFYRKIYAQNGKIISSKKELVFTPQKYSAKALQYIDSMYQLKLKHPSSYSVATDLTMAAWNGDTTSAQRLRNFKNTFNSLGKEEYVIDNCLMLLDRYDSLIQNGGTVSYYDLSQLPIFQND